MSSPASDPTFDAVWTSILHDCALEHVPVEKTAVAARLAGPDDVAALVARIEAVDAELARFRPPLDDDDDADDDDPDDDDDDDDGLDDAGDRSDEVFRAQWAATLTLAAIGEPAVDPLIALLGRGGPIARGRGAAAALERIGSPRAARAATALGEALTREHDNQAAPWLINALVAVAGGNAYEHLPRWLEPPQRANRWQPVRMAATGMVRLRGPEALDALLVATTNADPEIRMGVAQALSMLDLPAAANALARLAEDAHPRVRATARRHLPKA